MSLLSLRPCKAQGTKYLKQNIFPGIFSKEIDIWGLTSLLTISKHTCLTFHLLRAQHCVQEKFPCEGRSIGARKMGNLVAIFLRPSRYWKRLCDGSLEIPWSLLSRSTIFSLIWPMKPIQKKKRPRLVKEQHLSWKLGRKVKIRMFLTLLKDQNNSN